MPMPKDATPAQKRRIKRCEHHLEGKPGINKYAVCRASVMGKKKRLAAAVKRRIGRR